jgi:hypothetical protein
VTLLACLPLLTAVALVASLLAASQPATRQPGAKLPLAAAGHLSALPAWGGAGALGVARRPAQAGTRPARGAAPAGSARTAAGGTRAATRATTTAGTRSGITGGALFGGNTPLLPEVSKLGRNLAIIRVYDLIGQKFPSPRVRRWLSHGSTLILSIDTRRYSPSYSSIAGGHYDSVLTHQLEAVDQAAVQYHLPAIYVDFEHEANNVGTHSGLGSAAQFRRAWDHVHQIAVSHHLNWNQGGRLHWVEIMTHDAYFSSAASTYWVGASEADMPGVDGYNTDGCRLSKHNYTGHKTKKYHYRTPSYLFTPAVQFAHRHGNLPLLVAEFASIAWRSPALQPGFIHQMQSYVTANHEIAAALYWNEHGHGNGCDYNIDNRPLSLAALKSMAHSPALQGHTF